MDLVEEAGIDITDWAKSSNRGKKWAAANPKYCYEWAFIETGKVVVLNLWFDLMQEPGICERALFTNVDTHEPAQALPLLGFDTAGRVRDRPRATAGSGAEARNRQTVQRHRSHHH